MKKLVSAAEMRRLEQETADLGLPGPALMENAGRAVADGIRARYPADRFQRVLVVVGPGNNGGDGLVTARHLHDFGYAVVVYFAGRPLADDAKLRLLRQRAIPFFQLADDPTLAIFREALRSSAVVLDAVFGTGRLRPLAGPIAAILDGLRGAIGSKRVVALDVPSGIDADTGAADPHAAGADLTITLGEPKRGLVLGSAVDLAGEIVVADIGVPVGLADSLITSFADAPAVARLLPARPLASNKGSFGRVLIVAGSALYTGAPVLAALGAERSGAGLVTIACPRSVQPTLAAHTLEST
ncbi:MAG TPA: NAD(P)H-hydrate epimerase, partial [Chloroflexota bacterium]|nr:NAD(P)H-hydrate epimerase [Chloroflexota bacterium]